MLVRFFLFNFFINKKKVKTKKKLKKKRVFFLLLINKSMLEILLTVIESNSKNLIFFQNVCYILVLNQTRLLIIKKNGKQILKIKN